MIKTHHESTKELKAIKLSLDTITEQIATQIVDAALKVYRALKSVEEIHPIHEAQLLTYLRLSGKRLGFLINFNAPNFKSALRRRVL